MDQARNEDDPEKFIIGLGSYTNLETAIPFENEIEFRIDPAPMPTTFMLVTNAVFVVLTFAFYWVGTTYGNGDTLHFALSILGIGALTCFGFTMFVYYAFDNARRSGPWLVINKLSNKVTLPR